MYVHMCLCICVWSGLCLSLSWLASVSVTVATSSWAESVTYIIGTPVTLSHFVNVCSHFLILSMAPCERQLFIRFIVVGSAKLNQLSKCLVASKCVVSRKHKINAMYL